MKKLNLTQVMDAFESWGMSSINVNFLVTLCERSSDPLPFNFSGHARKFRLPEIRKWFDRNTFVDAYEDRAIKQRAIDWGY